MTPRTSHEHVRLVRSLFPDLASSLDAAYEQFRVGDSDGPPGSRDFDAWLDDEAERLMAGSLGQAPFAGLPDAVGERLERAFSAARLAAKRLNVALPEPETFVAAGADFAQFGAHMLADPSLLAVPTPFGLGADAWKEGFRVAALSDTSAFISTPERPDPLLLASEALAEFSVLDAPPGRTISVVASTRDDGQSVTWTVRLVPAGEKPPVLGSGFTHGPHVTLPEMLMVQLMRSALGETPVDTTSFTWLAGTLAGGRLAARHVFDEREGVIRVNCREVGNQGPHLGARSPIS